MTQQLIGQAKKFFEECVFGFVYHDIQSAINSKSNYLAALGLVAYTEFMGGLVNGTLGQQGKSRQRFYTFWGRMGPEYVALKSKREVVKIYSNVRCGLAHSYFIAQNSVVKMSMGGGYGKHCGIEAQEPSGKIVFIVEKYFEDFKVACEQYYRELIEQNDPGLLQRFQQAVGNQWYFNEMVAAEG